MTKQEINRDIKRLYKRFNTGPYDVTDWNAEQWRAHEQEKQEENEEFKRLYKADTTLKSMNRKSILMLYRINQARRIIQFHIFGINAKI